MALFSIEGVVFPGWLAGHLTLIFKDDLGSEFVIRGGQGDNGLIEYQINMPLNESKDARGDQTEEDRGHINLSSGETAVQDWVDAISIATYLQSKNYKYSYLGPNSNSVVATIMFGLDYDLNKNLPKTKYWAPLGYLGKGKILK